MRLRGRGIYWLPASTWIIAKSSIGNSSAPRSKPYRNRKWAGGHSDKRLEDLSCRGRRVICTKLRTEFSTEHQERRGLIRGLRKLRKRSKAESRSRRAVNLTSCLNLSISLSDRSGGWRGGRLFCDALPPSSNDRPKQPKTRSP